MKIWSKVLGAIQLWPRRASGGPDPDLSVAELAARFS